MVTLCCLSVCPIQCTGLLMKNKNRQCETEQNPKKLDIQQIEQHNYIFIQIYFEFSFWTRLGHTVLPVIEGQEAGCVGSVHTQASF